MVVCIETGARVLPGDRTTPLTLFYMHYPTSSSNYSVTAEETEAQRDG